MSSNSPDSLVKVTGVGHRNSLELSMNSIYSGMDVNYRIYIGETGTTRSKVVILSSSFLPSANYLNRIHFLELGYYFRFIWLDLLWRLCWWCNFKLLVFQVYFDVDPEANETQTFHLHGIQYIKVNYILPTNNSIIVICYRHLKALETGIIRMGSVFFLIRRNWNTLKIITKTIAEENAPGTGKGRERKDL